MNTPKLGEMAEFKVYGKVTALRLGTLLGGKSIENCTVELRTSKGEYIGLIEVPLSCYLPMEEPAPPVVSIDS